MSALAELLREAFDVDLLPADCWVTNAFPTDQVDFKRAIDVVSEYEGRSDLITRLRDEHPMGGQHLVQHDDRLMDVFTEAEAFAWGAAVAKLGTPRFVFEEGYPDLVAGSAWIEAKTVNRSDEEVAEIRQSLNDGRGIGLRMGTVVPPHPGLLAKFDYHLQKALKQRDHVAGGAADFTTFFEWAGIDLGTSPDEARKEVTDWAVDASRQHNVRIVIAFNYRWRTAEVYAPP